MAIFHSNCSSPTKFVLEEEGLTILALKRYEGSKEDVVARFRRSNFLENNITESELQKILSKYTNGKKVLIQKEITYLFAKY